MTQPTPPIGGMTSPDHRLAAKMPAAVADAKPADPDRSPVPC